MSDSPLPDLTRPPLDIQHDTDPEGNHGLARRIPHLGHTLLFFSICAFCILLCIAVALAIVHGTSQETAAHHPLAAAMGQVAGYGLTFLIAVPLYPNLWTVTFWQGIHWTPRPAKLHWWKLVLLGLGLSVLAQVSERFISAPTDTDVLQLFSTPLSAWLTVILGTFIPTFVEEVAFRGFLLPSLATAYDWLSLERKPAALQRWEQTTNHTVPAWIFAAVFSSLAFTALHSFQLHGSKGPLLVLFAVSLAFCAVRIHFRSVAASTLVHMAYDALIFAEMVIATGGFRHLDKLR